MAARTITLTDIPDAVYERLEEYAKADGITLPELVRRELLEMVPSEQQRNLGEWLDWLDTLEPIRVRPGAVVEALHAARAER
jgi:hypothetical protein